MIRAGISDARPVCLVVDSRETAAARRDGASGGEFAVSGGEFAVNGGEFAVSGVSENCGVSQFTTAFACQPSRRVCDSVCALVTVIFSKGKPIASGER
eukprot:667615-Prorocentrum_minimum.AAC.1